MCGDDPHEATTDPSEPLCLGCQEGFYADSDACLACPTNARRCVNSSTVLLCADGRVADQATCTDRGTSDALLVTNNHTTKCIDGRYPLDSVCGECMEHCVSCIDSTSCSVCEGTVFNNGRCSLPDNALAQTHNGVLACDDGFLPSDKSCAECWTVFGEACIHCNGHECLTCAAGFVLDNGGCRQPSRCTASDGTICLSCEADSVPFNTTDCVDTSNGCAEYDEGRCIRCLDGMFREGAECVSAGSCEVTAQGTCLRCQQGMFVDADGLCQRRPTAR